MQNIADKADSTAGSTGELTATEYNDHKNELQGSVTRSGQSLSAATLLQLSKALFINGAAATSVQDSGSGDSIILSPVTGASGLVVPDDYSHFDGGLLLFTKADPNVTTAVTINFGQTGTELGAKTVVRSDGTVPLAGDIEGLCLVQWDNSNNRWVLIRNGTETFGYSINSDVTVSPKFKKNIITVDTSGGNRVITIDAPEAVGQEVDIICDGTGYVDVTFPGQESTAPVRVTNGKKLSLKGKDGGDWIADSGVCGEYDTGADVRLTVFTTNGKMTHILDDFVGVTTKVVTLPISFAGTTSDYDAIPKTDSNNGRYITVAKDNLSQVTLYGWTNAGTSAAANGSANIEGAY